MKLPLNQILQGDVIEKLKELPKESIDMVITSPPYYGLRNYGVDGQIGLEPTFEEFLEKILQITAEVKRVLKKTGTFWLNFGDCYGGNPAGNTEEQAEEYAIKKGDGLYLRKGQQCKGAKSFTYATDNERMFSGKGNSSRLKQTANQKCMLMQPERLAIKMIDEQSWILRNKIKWAKQVLIKKENKTIGSVMPSSVKDRFNESGEELYFFVKSKKYNFNLDAVRMPNQVIGVTDMRDAGILRQKMYEGSKYNQDISYKPSNFVDSGLIYKNSKYRGKFRGKEDAENFNSLRARSQRKNLDERLDDTKNKDIKSSRSYNVKKLLSEVRLGIKPNTGMEKVKYDISERQTELVNGGVIGSGQRLRGFFDEFGGENNPAGKNLPTVWQIGSEPHNFQRELGVDTDHFAIFPEALVEIPIKAGCPENGVVLDIFGGSGTVGVVAKQLKRNYILIELNPKYIEIAKKRLRATPTPLL